MSVTRQWDEIIRELFFYIQHQEFIVNIVNLILAIILPPVGAFLQVGVSKHFIINIILTLLGFLPGVIHAVWLVVTEQKG